MIEIDQISYSYVSQIENFCCADQPDVEAFLKKNAIKYHEQNLAKTHLVFKSRELIGYFSLFVDHVTVPKGKRNAHGWELSALLDKQMFPSIRIHYLGIDVKYRKQGLGKLLLFLAIDTCMEVNELAGCTFVTVEALEGTVDFYKRHNFEVLSRAKHDVTDMIFKLEEIELNASL